MASRGSRHHAALDRRKWRRARLAALDRDGWRCRQCGKPGRLEVDHRKRLEDGGAAYDLANLQTLCRGCHIAKTRAENTRPDAARDAWRALVAERMTAA